jgi:glycosyltransferase involved in cell wall biosynthesis
LNYLHSTGKYEIAEMAAYGEKNDPRAANIPWKYYGVMPNQSCEPKASEEELRAYQSNPTHQFGAWAFEHVCLDFLPDFVCDIRDFWMLDFAERSPFRDYFRWVIMPTVDARPQARQWIATYAGADACLTYSDWAGGVLEDQSGGKINYLGSAPPSAHPAYKPIPDKTLHKIQMGIDPSYKVIGTVMRNQRRKLYPDLFEAFRKFLDMSEDKNYYLYCHTSYPDLGWAIDELLQEHNLASHVLFTYICPETKKPFVSKFKGAFAQSPYTNKWGATLSNVKNGLSYEDLSRVVNCFDLYTQYANCEGFGLPQVEAAACGVPVCGTDYSAMESVLRKLGGFPLTPAALYKELETGCLRAVPDNANAAQFFYDFFQKSDEEREEIGRNTREAFDKYYQWHLSGSVWENYFDSTDPVSFDKGWGSSPDVQEPAPKETNLEGKRHSDITKWLIENVLRKPEKVNSFFADRMTKDLLYKSSTSSTGGMYFNESSAAFDGQAHRSHFDYNVAYDQMKSQRDRINHWEQVRMKRIESLNVQ